MELLKKLTPAETYFIMHRGAISHKDYLRYTFMDLILKGVLKIVEVEKQASAQENTRVLPYVESGTKFSNYHLLPHEAPLITSFKFDDDMRVQLNNFIKVTQLNTGGYKKLLHSSSTVSQYFNQNFIQRFITLEYSYVNGGEKISNDIRYYFSNLDVWLITSGNEHRYPEIIEQIGNNILLAQNFSRSFFEVFDKELKKQFNNSDGYGAAGCSGCTTDSDSGCSGCGGGGCGGGD